MKNGDNPKHTLYILIIILTFIVFSGILVLFSLDRIRSSVEESRMIPLIKEHLSNRENEAAFSSLTLYFPIVSAVDDSYRFTSISVEVKKDSYTYHRFIEELLAKVPQGALIEGAVSFIPENTALIGFTISRSIGYIDLSSEFISDTPFESGYEKRIAQVRKNLTENFSLDDVVIMIEGEILSVEQS
ncbi:MAG: GerMN domain-containing protein [Sphaerochaetaceae bacterium]|nr:GerMN domain-containing protein [Sphaerochaetaceae bacterium]